ncbi:ATP-binding protein [uncultured Sulfitobacter sp.]|uniref:ATP-binding protein n=1 Tax=uncultured Sulfitobacter sp. TaxID=191468 RepID=UPI00262C12F9|nr:ATP-binding protein [uncultured Sulfitobacter sp.]
MSNINVRRAVENIRSGTNVYTPLVETIVNAIQAIEAGPNAVGSVDISVARSNQKELGSGQPSVESFTVVDNGIGFNNINRDSFDTLYSDHKIAQGGKGFGRFTCLKYFDDLTIESIFEDESGRKKRSFKMGKQTDIIVNESVEDCAEGIIGSRVTMLKAKRAFPDRKLTTIARSLIERLLPYFIDSEYQCPEIGIAEEDGTGRIILNDFVSNQLAATIKEIPLEDGTIVLGTGEKAQTFQVRVFKLFSPRNQRSKVSLVADRREVTDTALHSFVPEFADEFFEERSSEGDDRDRNYIVKAYVFGTYLDANVSLERGDFKFPKGDDLLHAISQAEIEQAAAYIARNALGDTITARQEKKRVQVQDYVEISAPWHRTIAADIELSAMPYNPSPEQIETVFQKEKFSQEVAIRQQVDRMLNETDADGLNNGLPKIIDQISKTSRNDLIHYIALRKHVLTLFGKSFELSVDQKYPSEGTVHDIIFPRKGDTAATALEDHNLWIIDERLNFTNFVSSDKPLDGGSSERPDLLVFDTPVLFRGDNEASNPITVFEFKRPGRDDFVNPSSKEDPVQQIVRYVNSVRDGKFKTPTGRPIQVADNTPFYGYVMCETSEKVKKWLENEKQFTPMPDGMGWFQWFGNIRLYMEVLSWDKVLRDAEMRNSVFFHKLGIH